MIFEVGEEYWLTYGSTEEQSHDCIKVLEVEGTWLKVEAEKVEPLINVAAPMFISARKRDRQTEHSALESLMGTRAARLAKDQAP